MATQVRKAALVVRAVKNAANSLTLQALIAVGCFPTGYEAVNTQNAPQLYLVSNLLDKIRVFIGSEDVGSQNAAQFPQFSRLPAEIRMKIWSFVELEPAVIVQYMTREKDVQYKFSRSIPPVLHACRESRFEFLDTGVEGEKKNGMDVVHKQAHPTYKLYFTGPGHMSYPVFFAPEIDRMWAMHCPGQPRGWYTKTDHRGQSTRIDYDYFGLTQMDNASKLERLDLFLDRNIVGNLHLFPNLKVLTFIVPACEYDESETIANMFFPSTTLGPEVDGQIDTEALTDELSKSVRFERTCLKEDIEEQMKLHPNWTPPVILFRASEQYGKSECPEVKLRLGWREFVQIGYGPMPTQWP